MLLCKQCQLLVAGKEARPLQLWVGLCKNRVQIWHVLLRGTTLHFAWLCEQNLELKMRSVCLPPMAGCGDWDKGTPAVALDSSSQEEREDYVATLHSDNASHIEGRPAYYSASFQVATATSG